MFRFSKLMLVPAALLVICTSTVASNQVVGSDKLSQGEHDAPIRDVQLHYTVAGHGPLVFVCSPGWGAGSLYLQRGLTPLEDQFTLLFIDTRGSGKSSKPADPKIMSTSDMADDIEALRRYLSLDQINLIGHSDSGAIALFYAERYPSKLSKLVVIDGISYGHTAANKQEAENLGQIKEGLANDPRYKTAFQPFKPEGSGDAAMMQMMQHSLPLYFNDPKKNMPAFASSMEGTTPSSFAGMANSKANHAQENDSTSHLSDIKAATLIVVGKQDWVCPVLNSEHIHQAIGGSELVQIEASGHFPWIEQPTVFFKTVAAFLKG